MQNRRIVMVFSLITALFAAGYGVMFTVLDDFRDEYGIAKSSLGLVVAVGFFASFVAQVFFAPLADRGHARAFVLTGMLLSIAGLIGMAVGTDIGVLLLARLVMGLGAGVALPALRRIVILADPDNIGRNIGRLLAADVAGFAMGPAVSAILVAPFGIPTPFIVIAVATAATLPVLLKVRVDETIVEDQTQARLAFDLLRIRPFVGALCFGAAVFIMIGTFDALWVLVLDDLDTADWIANLGITLFGVLPLVFLGPMSGRLAQRVGPFRIGTIGLLGGAVFMFLYGQLPTGLAMFVVSMLHALNDGFTISSSGVAAAVVVTPERQAGAQGMLGGAQTLVGGISAVMAGRLYETYGRATAYTVCSIIMIVLVAVGLACVGRSWWVRPSDEIIDAVVVPDHLPAA